VTNFIGSEYPARSLRFWILSPKKPAHHLSGQKQQLAILAAVRDRNGVGQPIRAPFDAFSP
jgi:hypothetical protein